MIKHHPKLELLQSFANGELPASLSAGIAIHAEMCPICREKIDQITEQIAEKHFEISVMDSSIDEFIERHENQSLTNTNIANVNLVEFEGTSSIDDKIIKMMIDDITANTNVESTSLSPVKPVNTLNFKGIAYSLPNVLKNMDIAKPTNIGKLSRAKIQLDEGEIHTNILHIEPGGSVPEHTHKGYELTLLLAGSFSDDKGEYVAGDFIMLDNTHTHKPISENGCLCYTVANDALHFTQGINRLLNPIGSLIY